ncbi:MAG TPA: MFS transporter [Bryobacteraceae bacterium]|nr:MFS transporter [Bryobacteraceae bacterium]
MKIPKFQWVIAGMLFAATMINYADRLTLSVVSVDIRREFGLTEGDYSHVVTLFLLAYAIMYAGSGYILDRLGTKRGFAVFVAAWSAAQMLHGLVIGKWTLGGARFLLGLAEPGNWPAAAKAVAEWFPPDQRAFGIGIFNAGSSFGSAIAPPMVVYLTHAYGWRAAFYFTGAIGFLWVVVWMILYDSPEKSTWLRRRDMPNLTDVKPAVVGARPDWRKVIRMRECYTLILTRFFTDPVIYFVIFWLPEYLRKERHFDLSEVGRYAWVPFIFGDVGYLLGGWLSGRLMRAGWTLPRARKIVMLIGAAVMPAAILAPFVPTSQLAIAATCFVTFGHGFWVSNLQALPTDLFRSSEIGSASGFSGMGGAIGGMLANMATGYIVAKYSYAPIFILAGLVHPLSIFLIYKMLPDRYFFNRTAGSGLTV